MIASNTLISTLKSAIANSQTGFSIIDVSDYAYLSNEVGRDEESNIVITNSEIYKAILKIEFSELPSPANTLNTLIVGYTYTTVNTVFANASITIDGGIYSSNDANLYITLANSANSFLTSKQNDSITLLTNPNRISDSYANFPADIAEKLYYSLVDNRALWKVILTSETSTTKTVAMSSPRYLIEGSPVTLIYNAKMHSNGALSYSKISISQTDWRISNTAIHELIMTLEAQYRATRINDIIRVFI